jgi:protein transport protein SEC24
MMVVTELEEPFLPLPDDMLVNLRESREVVDALLDSLPSNWPNANLQSADSATGPALQVGCGRPPAAAVLVAVSQH